MKQIKIFFLSMAVCMVSSFILPGCNNSSEKKADGKVTDIPANTKSKDALASFQQGLLSYDLGDNKKARAAFSKTIEQDPKFGIAYLYRANLANSPKEFADDANAGKANLDSASDWEKMYGDYQVAGLSGDRNKQVEILQKLAAAYPDAARAQVELGNAYSGNNQFDKSRACYQKATELDAKWVGGYGGLANSYLFNDPKDLKKAEENAMKVVDMAPTSAGAEILVGDCYRAENDFQKAKDAYAKAVTLDPDSPDGYAKEGNANTYLGNIEEARKNFLDGSTHDENNKLGYLVTTAFTYLYANNDYKTAMKTLMDGAAKVDSASKNGASQKNNFLATCGAIAFHYNDAAMLKQMAPMLQSLSEKLNNDLGTPEGKIFAKADAMNWQVMIDITDGKLDDAKAKVEEMKSALDPIKDDRKLEGYHYLMGMISMKQKKYADAVTHFEKADLTQIYNKYWLAMANEAAGNKDKATALYKEVAAYNFNDVGNALVRGEVKKKLAMP